MTIEAVICTTVLAKRQHRSLALRDDLIKAGRAGKTICGKDGVDEARLRWLRPAMRRRIDMTQLPMCRRCLILTQGAA